MVTLAEAVLRHEASQPGALKCAGRCRHRRPREEFRETPWHGRAAACKRCEGLDWRDRELIEQRWEHEQTRARLRAYETYSRRLRVFPLYRQRYVMGWGAQTTADLVRAYEAPFVGAVQRAEKRWGPVIEQMVRQASAVAEEDYA